MNPLQVAKDYTKWLKKHHPEVIDKIKKKKGVVPEMETLFAEYQRQYEENLNKK